MNKYEEMFVAWLDEQKAKQGLVSVNHSTTDGDNSSEEFFKEACEIINADARVVSGKENLTRYKLDFPLK